MAGLTLIADSNPSGGGASDTAEEPVGTAVGDLVGIFYTYKRAANTLATPSGWNATTQHQVGTGTAGEGTGPLKVGAFWRTLAAAFSGPTLTPSGTTGNIILCGTVTWRPDTGWTAEVTSTSGSDTSNDTNFAVTGADVLPFVKNDWRLDTVALTNNTVSQAALDALSGTAPGGASGATFEVYDGRWNSQSSTGDNMRTQTISSRVLGGLATTAPSLAVTTDAAITGGVVTFRVHPVHYPWHVLGIDGSSAGNHFKLQAAPDGGGAIFEKTRAEIVAGYYQDPYFIAVGEDQDWVQFRVRMDSQTTAGTDYPRSELREMESDGTTNRAFNTSTGTHWMRGRFQVTELPPVKPSVVVAQVHDGSSDVFQLLTAKNAGTGLVEVQCKVNGSGAGMPVLVSDYQLGDVHDYYIEFVDGTFRLYFDDLLVPALTTTAINTSTAYFKTGCYAQSNETIDSATAHMAVWLKQLQVWHTGQPTPLVPVGLSTVSAGADASIAYGASFDRTATDTGTVTAREWTIISGPSGVGTTIGTAAALSWAPPAVNGTYRLRYGATTADGTNVDDVLVTVTVTEVAKAGSDTVTFALTDDAQVGTPVAKATSDTVTFGLTDTATADKQVVKAASDTVTFGLTDTAERLVIAPTIGSWLSPPLALPQEAIAGSLLFWRASLPDGTSLLVETSVDNGATWQEAMNKGPVPNLPVGSESVKAVLVRAIMRRDSPDIVSPELLRMELRVALDSSRDVWVQLGRFRLAEAEVVHSDAGVTVRLAGSDMSRNIARNTWDESLVIPAGTNVRDAIMIIISNRWPEATFNLPSTEFTTTRLFYGPGIGSGNPWADARKLAREAAGWELFPDAFGVITGRPVPDPDTQPAVFSFSDSQYPTMESLSRRMTDEDTYNQVLVIAQSTSIEEAVYALWQDTDPTSKTRIDGDYGIVTKTIRTDKAVNAEQCQVVADAEGRAVKGATEVVRVSALCAPFLDPGDVVEVTDEVSKTTGRFLTDGWHIDLGPQSLMSLTTRRQRA